jgi:hypothetical protein
VTDAISAGSGGGPARDARSVDGLERKLDGSTKAIRAEIADLRGAVTENDGDPRRAQ